MAFDPNQHKLDAQGFIVDKDSGHRVGMENPQVASPKDVEFPKWVAVHDSHVVKQNAAGEPHISVARWPFEIDRVTNVVRVLVQNAQDEAEAIAAAVVEHHDEAPHDQAHEDAEKNAM